MRCDMGNLIIWLIFLETFVQCFVITPRTIPEDIELFNTNHDQNNSHVLQTVKQYKPWLMYIDANIFKSFSECLSRMLIGAKFSEMWQCTLHYSASSQILKYKMKMFCPAPYKSVFNINHLPAIFIKEKQEADIKPDKQIIALITISTTKCPKLLDLWLNVKNPQLILTIYKFEIEPVLRLNVTFLHFELEKLGIVMVINGNSCSITNMLALDYDLQCFKARIIYS